LCNGMVSILVFYILTSFLTLAGRSRGSIVSTELSSRVEVNISNTEVIIFYNKKCFLTMHGCSSPIRLVLTQIIPIALIVKN